MLHKNITMGICYFFFVIALITGSLGLVLGLGLVPDSQAIEASSDNEFRFFSAFWLGYGLFCFWVARDLSSRGQFIPFLALVMFVGGVGRCLSYLLVGPPVPLYSVGALIELAVPILWYFSHRQLPSSANTAA